MPPPLPRFTLEYCEQLLRQNPAACGRLYWKVRKEVVEVEANNGESQHRWDVRRALLVSREPLTAMQCANWARDRGNTYIDRALAASILRNLLSAGEVVEVLPPNGGFAQYKATGQLKTPPERKSEVSAPPPVEPAAPPVSSPHQVAIPEETTTIGKVISACSELHKLGQVVCFRCPGNQALPQFAQNVRTSLNSRACTRDRKYKVQQLPPDQISVEMVGIKPNLAQRESVPPVRNAAPDAIAEAAPQQTKPQPAPVAPADRTESACRALLVEINNRIANLIEARDAIERVLPILERTAL